MEIILNGKIFIARATYDEREIPKRAGMRWNPEKKHWYSIDPVIANRLREYATIEAKNAIDAALNIRTETIEASRATDAEIDIPAPENMTYLPFQRAGISYASNRPATLIADEMGLGKTIQAIGVINTDNTIKNVLVICPASLKINWSRELTKWLVFPLTIGIANGDIPDTNIVIVNYDILKKHHTAIMGREWDVLISDECHYLKNPKSQRTQMVLGNFKSSIPPIPARRKLFLTGTPIVNRPIELYPIASMLNPAEFGSWKRYVTRYCNGHETKYGWDVSGASNLAELQEKLRATIMVRRLKMDVLTELPPKRRQIIDLPVNGSIRAVENEKKAWADKETLMQELRAKVELMKASENPDDYKNAVDALRDGARAAFTEIAKLRHETAIAKIPSMIEFLHAALDDDEAAKIVFFAHHHDVIDAVVKEFDGQAVTLTGDSSMIARQAAVDRFQSDKNCRVFVGSITAAGVGITLTASSHVIFGELDWVPGNISQAEDRTHRIGQVNSVLVQHLVLDGSLDATMARTLVDKQEIIDKALDKKDGEIEEIEIPVIPVKEEPATAKTSRKKIIEESEKITAEEINDIHTKLRIISDMCDGAQSLDGIGFNKFDAQIGHVLAQTERLTAKQAALGKVLVKKYYKQIN